MRKFRSVEEWKSALMTLPDLNFFELLRSIFGNIKTPFSKQRLLEDLNNLLSREEIKKVISAYISEQDHKLIAAVALLGEPAPGILETFFAGEYSYAELHAMVVNLEERLIIYRFRDEGIMRLALNPVLEEALNPFIENNGLIFPSLQKARPGQAQDAGMNDNRYMAALFSFFQAEEELFRMEAGTNLQEAGLPGIRKKVLDEWKKIFPLHDLGLAIRIMIQMDLFKYEDRRLIPRNEKIADFAALSSIERQEYWAAAMYLCLDEASRHENAYVYLNRVSKIRLRGIASFIHRFRACIDPEKLYPETTLRRMYMLLEKNDALSGKTWGYPLFDGPVQLDFGLFLTVIEDAGLFEKEKTHWKAFPACGENSPVSDKPVIAMDSAFSILLYPEISFPDALALGSFCSIKGSVFCLELTRQSAVRGFDSGLGAGAMHELLERLSGSRLDSSLGWTLKEWEDRYEKVALHQGTILCLAEDRHYLAEAGPVASLIRRTLAPGVFLLSPGVKSQAATALRKAGVDIIARPPEQAAGTLPVRAVRSSHGPSRDSLPRLGAGKTELPIGVTAAAKKNCEAESYLENLRRVMESMKLGKEEREELSARIERRLILSEAQLEATSLRYEKTEARLLDYRGKLSIAKNAVESGSLVEVCWAGAGGRQKRFTGIAQALEKEEGDSILVIRKAENSRKSGDAIRVPGNTIRIPLGKISLLRRIKQSIFGG